MSKSFLISTILTVFVAAGVTAGDADSFQAGLREALDAAESAYTQSDSTVELVFYEEGIPHRVYYPDYAKASDVYEKLLKQAEDELGTSDLFTSDILMRLAEAYRVLGRYAESESLLKLALGIRERHFGKFDPRVAEVLERLGVAYFYLGRYVDAAVHSDSSLAMRDSLLGPDHPAVIRSCYALARAIIKLGYYEGAIAFSERALAIAQKQFVSDSVEIASAIAFNGFAIYFNGDYLKSEAPLSQALEMRRRMLPKNHLDLAVSCFDMGNMYRWTARRELSELQLKKAREIRVAVLGPDHPDVAEADHYLGLLYQYLSPDYRLAIDHYTEALRIRREVFEPEHPEYIRAVYRLGQCHRRIGEFETAEAYYRDLLRLREVTSGVESGAYVTALTAFAELLQDQGRLPEALSYRKGSVELANKVYGDTSQQVAQSLYELGFTYYRMGEFDDAEREFRRAVEIAGIVYGKIHPEVAEYLGYVALVLADRGRLNEAMEAYGQALEMFEQFPEARKTEGYATLRLNLGIAYEHIRNHEKSEESVREALVILEEVFGREFAGVAVGLLNLGLALEGQGRFAEADSIYRESIELGERILGENNPGLAHALNNRANLQVKLGQYDEAERNQLRAVSILENALGGEHPEVAKFRRDLGRLYAYAGKTAGSLESYGRFIDWSQKFLENVFPYSSEEQKLRWIDIYPISDRTLFSLALENNEPASRRLALEMLLKSKAMVIEAVMAEKKAAVCHYDEAIMAKLDELGEVNSLIAGLSMASGYYKDSVQALYALKDSIEVYISRHCSEFSDALAARRFELKDIVNAVPEGSVVWEFVRYQPTNLDASVLGDDKIGSPRYLAFTFDNGGNVTISDLGDAAYIDSLIFAARDLIYRSQGQIYSVAAITAEQRLNEVTSQLYKTLFKPLESKSNQAADIYISPDGMLNLLPMEILPMDDGRYVIEKYRISYLSSGRDLLKHDAPLPPSGEIIVMADPDFDGTESEDTEVFIDDEHYGPQMRGNTECLKDRFNPLPFSRDEASSLVSVITGSGKRRVNECYGRRAGERRLKELSEAPCVLHLATHGFFCEGDDESSELKNNPLLRSGLVLAGANRTISGQREDGDESEDGILTALEVSGLNLVGTELAVLSACESGVGEFVNGEGMFGLRRAFQHAGAGSVIMSLWSVPDKETSLLMDGFYKRWLEGKSKRDALRESAIERLNQSRDKRGCGHPLLWGGFILAGNPN